MCVPLPSEYSASKRHAHDAKPSTAAPFGGSGSYVSSQHSPIHFGASRPPWCQRDVPEVSRVTNRRFQDCTANSIPIGFPRQRAACSSISRWQLISTSMAAMASPGWCRALLSSTLPCSTQTSGWTASPPQEPHMPRWSLSINADSLPGQVWCLSKPGTTRRAGITTR